jgi:cytoskeletal protein RodZ
MDETFEPRDDLREPEPKKENKKETAGDILRKERVTKRISLETIAKDLKLNIKYIRALEENNYENLPADPYIRVYLLSMAKYLMLDSEEILQRFYEERGIPSEEYQKDPSTKINITLNKKESPRISWITIVIIILAVVAFIVLINRFGFIETIPPSELNDTDTSVTRPDSLTGDSDSATQSADESIEESGETEIETESETERETDESSESHETNGKDTMVLKLRTGHDSSWVHVYADGESWKNTMKPNRTRAFSAKDSFNVHAGNRTALSFFLNGKKIKDIPRKNIVTFKLSHSGVETWTLKKWQTVFEERM